MSAKKQVKSFNIPKERHLNAWDPKPYQQTAWWQQAQNVFNGCDFYEKLTLVKTILSVLLSYDPVGASKTVKLEHQDID